MLNELKDLNELNNQVLISLSEYLTENYKHLLTEQQTKEFKIIQLTAKIFQILVQKRAILPFDSYKRHHSQPMLIIEQLLMNSHIDLCSRTIKMCRDSMNDPDFHAKINQLLVRYARKALEFKVYINNKNAKEPADSMLVTGSKNRSPPLTSFSVGIAKNDRKTSVSINIIAASPANSNSNSNSSKLSTSFKSFYKFSNSTTSNNNLNLTNSNLNQLSSSLNTISPNLLSVMSNSSGNSFVMPNTPPSKEDWVKDDDVQECMVCNTRRFSLLNRRHHCRRCGRVVCSNCSERVTLIDNIPKRTCDDCFKQIELQKINANEKVPTNEAHSSEFAPGSSVGKNFFGKI